MGPPSGIDPGNARVIHRLQASKLELLMPLVMGTYIDTVLLGLVVVALVYWYRNVRPTDPKWVRALVAVQMILTCIQTGVLMASWFRVFINGFGEIAGIRDSSAARFVGPIHVCQWIPTATFFLVRAHNLANRHWAIWTPVVILMLASFSAGIAGCVIFTTIPPPPLLQKLTIFRTAIEAAVDIFITASIVYGYWRNQSGWDSGDKVIRRLMRWTVETQAPPTIAVLGFMITIICQGETPAQTYWWFLPKIYVGVLLLALNARIKLEGKLRAFQGVYPPGSRNPDMAMPALRRIGRFNQADQEEVEEDMLDQPPLVAPDMKEASTSALI